METRYFETLVTAVEMGNFSRAAEALCVTQSAVSQRIKFLEEHYDCQLLDRTGPKLEPTSAGLIALKRARQILQAEYELGEDLKRLGRQKRISICCTAAFGIAHLPGVINAFVMQNSDVADLKFIFSTPGLALKGLREHEFDVAVLEHLDDLDLSSYQSYELPMDDLVIISAPSLGLPEGGLDLKTLFEQRLFIRKEGCSCRSLLESNLKKASHDIRDFKSVVVSDDLNLTVQSVLAGGGISFLSRCLVERDIAEGKLVAHSSGDFLQRRHCTLVVMPGRQGDPLLNNFLDCVFSTIGTS